MKDKNTRIAYRADITKLHDALPHAASPGQAARDLAEFALASISIELNSLHYKFTEAELELLASTVGDRPMRAEDRFHRWGLDLPAAIGQCCTSDGVTPELALALIGEVEALGKTQQAALTIALERYRALIEPKSFAQAGVVPRFADTRDSSQAQ